VFAGAKRILDIADKVRKYMAILVTGANGQIGTVLCEALRTEYGNDHVIGSDIIKLPHHKEPFVMLDILNVQRIQEVITDYEIDQIYHLAAILSANGEWNPQKTWNVNMNGTLSILEVARLNNINKIFYPSSIAVFGKTTPKDNTGQDVPMLPETVYGMSKLAGEQWCNYYFKRYDLDVRSLRFPGIISFESPPGGGTTDYAVHIFHKAVNDGKYTCFLKEGTRLPMIYMPDAIRATIEIMQTPGRFLKIRTSYNIAGMSTTPAEITREIQKFIPHFKIDYQPDFRQAIADSWVHSIDDTAARNDWGWEPQFDLEKTAQDMIQNLQFKES
jgi:threonine 3-dehydrogenase